MYFCYYSSPLGKMILASDGEAVKGLWFCDQKHILEGLDSPVERFVTDSCFASARHWLDAYFSAERISVSFPVEPDGTAFQKAVWNEIRKIPYGETATYKDIAAAAGCKSAQAVGQAVGRNPVSIIIPCHRVMGSGGGLTGYAGGLERKAALLSMERTGIRL